MDKAVYEVWVDKVRYATNMSLETALTLVKALCEKWFNDSFDITIKQRHLLKEN